MKASIRHRHRSPDVVEFTDVPWPAIEQGLVGVRASGVGSGDAFDLGDNGAALRSVQTGHASDTMVVAA